MVLLLLLLFRSLSYKKDETKPGAKKIFQRDRRPWTAMVGFYTPNAEMAAGLIFFCLN